MPSFLALSARFSWMPLPGKTSTPTGSTSSMPSLRLKGAALACFVQSGLKATCVTLRASAHLAAVFYRALGQKVRCTPVYKPTALDADDVAEVVHHFSDAALRLQPVALVNADARALIAQLAQDAARQGWLQASEAQQVRVAEAAH